jgi:hypothetical protein
VDVDARAGIMAMQADLSIDEAGKMLNPVQDGFNVQLNSWSPSGGWFVVVEQPQTIPAFGRSAIRFIVR